MQSGATERNVSRSYVLTKTAVSANCQLTASDHHPIWNRFNEQVGLVFVEVFRKTFFFFFLNSGQKIRRKQQIVKTKRALCSQMAFPN